MAKKTRRTYGDRRAKAAGVLTKPVVMRRKATRLLVVNAPNTVFMRRRHTVRAVGNIHGFKTVNSPQGGRRSAGVQPSFHGVNAPKGQW